jgi:hypothetical protein
VTAPETIQELFGQNKFQLDNSPSRLKDIWDDSDSILNVFNSVGINKSFNQKSRIRNQQHTILIKQIFKCYSI